MAPTRAIAAFALGWLVDGLQLESTEQQRDALLKLCESTHPAHLPEASVQGMSAYDVMECYATWHDATLVKWAKEPSKCAGRQASVMFAGHGLGDQGQSFADRFGKALRAGYMLLWDFGKKPTVWQHAMEPPFSWDFREHMHLFCLDPEKYDRAARHPQILDDFPDPTWNTVAFKIYEEKNARWNFLYRPNHAVQQAVKYIVDQVKPDEQLVGVHFRSQWFGSHMGCGCKDPTSIACFAARVEEMLRQRQVETLDWSKKIKFFIASDSFAGIEAFRAAFGDRVVSFPDSFPIEHALDVTEAGATRVFADFLALARSAALITSCGSTFSARVQDLSRLPPSAVLSTGNEECVVPKELNVTGFSKNMVRTTTYCDCYAESDTTDLPGHGGTCTFQCTASPELRPSKCSPSELAAHRQTRAEVQWQPQVPMGTSLSHSVEDFPWLA